MKIIGITGTLGAGKGTIVDYLTKHHGFTHFSVRGYLSKLIKAKGGEVNRDTLVATANELRAKNSPSFIAEELYREAAESGTDCIIESIRTVGEVNALHAKGNFNLFAVDADQKLRYQRIVERASETDGVTFDVFAANEAREMNSDDPNKQNLAACMKLADYRFVNDGSFDHLYRDIDEVLVKLK
ncbi:MAG TPA: AAA family ATPase [Chitinophagales bacterium]|nr:AAA family ATPase [Chitinophagales bacterium]